MFHAVFAEMATTENNAAPFGNGIGAKEPLQIFQVVVRAKISLLSRSVLKD